MRTAGDTVTQASALGDAGVPNDDPSYTGETSLSADYFRSKFGEFQVSLNALDASYQAGQGSYDLTGDDSIRLLLAEYDEKASSLKNTAEAMNLGAAAVNALGGRMPVLSIPATLGLPPLVIPAAAAAAIAAGAYYVAWAKGYTVAMSDAIRAVNESAADPDVKVALAEKLRAAQAAVSLGNSTWLSGIAGPIKWIALGVLGYLAYRLMEPAFDRD